MAKENSGNSKRERLRTNYLENGIGSMSEPEVLELFLLYALPESKAGAVAENLLKHFNGSIERVFTAEADELLKVEGVSRSVAALLSLVRASDRLVRKSKNNSIVTLSDSETACEYAKNELFGLNHERLILISLDEADRVIACNVLADGSINRAGAEPATVARLAINNRAKAVILSHNHPFGNSSPSFSDIMFTENVMKVVREIGVEMRDHIVVGEKEITSIFNDPRCRELLNIDQ